MKFKNSRKILIPILAGFSFILSNCSTNSDKKLLLDDNIINDPLVINLKRSEDFTTMQFISRYFKDVDWQAALAMNITYKPIIKIREKIAKYSGYNSLKFLTTWEPQGEAHITTITPVEYQECMWSDKRKIKVLRMDTIEKIANEIQKSDFKILGIRSGRKKFPARDKVDETFFVIVESNDLIEIRKSIYKRYISNGGNPKCWNPKEFYPHITLGFTHKDIHFPDVRKNLEGSLDKRFILK